MNTMKTESIQEGIREKVIWITGASRGIGRQLALLSAQRGAIVVATVYELDEHSRSLEAELKALSPRSLLMQQDVTCPEDATRVAERIKNDYGRVHVLINNAGIDPRVAADELNDDQWRDVLSTNLDGTWYCCRAAIPLMKQHAYGK